MRFKFMFLLLLLTGSSFADFGDNVYFTYQVGGVIPFPQTYSLTSTVPGKQTTGNAAHTSGQSWLYASVSSTESPLTLTIGVNPVGLAPGSYSGTVETTCNNCSNVLDFYVYLTVTPAPPPLTASPSSLTFNAVQGTGLSAVQTMKIGSAIPANTAIFTETTPTPLPSWLRVNNSTFWSGIFFSPASLSFSVDPSGLAPGTYTASINFYTIVPDTQVTVPITLNVTAPPPVLKTNVSSLQFLYILGSSAPSPQAVQVTSSGSSLTASVSLNASWLTVSTLNGTTPFSTNIGVNVNGLAAGTYKGQVTIATNPFGSQSSQSIDVTLTVAVDTRPLITSVVSAASFKPVISPGSWISIMGKNLSTATAQATSVWLPTSFNGVSAQLAGVGGAYSLLVHYVSPTQINAFVPYEVTPKMFGAAGGATVTITTAGGTTSSPVVDVEAIAPALFFYGENKTAAAVFPDGVIVGTIPGTRAVTAGSVISLYGTGFGQTNPSSSNVNGPVTVCPLALNADVLVNGVPAKVLWAGMVGIGLYQFNIEVPALAASGDYPVVVQIAGASSAGVILPVR